MNEMHVGGVRQYSTLTTRKFPLASGLCTCLYTCEQLLLNVFVLTCVPATPTALSVPPAFDGPSGRTCVPVG